MYARSPAVDSQSIMCKHDGAYQIWESVILRPAVQVWRNTYACKHLQSVTHRTVDKTRCLIWLVARCNLIHQKAIQDEQSETLFSPYTRRNLWLINGQFFPYLSHSKLFILLPNCDLGKVLWVRKLLKFSFYIYFIILVILSCHVVYNLPKQNCHTFQHSVYYDTSSQTIVSLLRHYDIG